jgi:hypothetical protein
MNTFQILMLVLASIGCSICVYIGWKLDEWLNL